MFEKILYLKGEKALSLGYHYGETMVSLIVTIVVMVPMVSMLSLLVSMYKWQQQNLEVENLAEQNMYTCRKAVQREIDASDQILEDEINKMKKTLASCDNSMLYYKGRCELDSTKFFCSKSILEGYLTLRGLGNADRSPLFAISNDVEH